MQKSYFRKLLTLLLVLCMSLTYMPSFVFAAEGDVPAETQQTTTETAGEEHGAAKHFPTEYKRRGIQPVYRRDHERRLETGGKDPFGDREKPVFSVQEQQFNGPEAAPQGNMRAAFGGDMLNSFDKAAAEQQERLAREKAEQERIARERAEQERLAREKAEQERIAREKAEQERLAREKAEQERLAREKAEQERLAQEKAEQERIARDKAEHERLAREKA